MLNLRLGAPLIAAVLLTTVLVPASVGAQALPTCDGKVATIVGTEGNDRISGTSGDDVIVGLGGRDRIAGGAGNDTICGGDGIDIIKGMRGRDRIFGEAGNDRLFGNVGRDHVEGGTGRDKVFGGAGDDHVSGGRGDDNVSGGGATDSCDLDRNDRYGLCEAGDVQGANGSANGAIALQLNDDFLVNQAAFGNGLREYFVMEFALDGPGVEDALTISVYDDQGQLIEFYNQRADSYVGEVVVNQRPARVEVDASGGSWDVVFKQRDLLARVGRVSGSDRSRVFFLKTPVGSNAEAALRLSPETSGNVIMEAWRPGQLSDLFVNTVYPDPNGFDTWSGPVRQGVTLVAVEVDFGRWSVEITD
jgi:Ca2+-binding RTX toxin-like protein